jgi:GTPase SAR1 family protein
MSKRPLFPNSTPARSTPCLDFLAWKLQQHEAQDDKLDDGKVYQPDTEDPPDELWYGIDLDLLGSNIARMCSDLGQPVAHTTIVDHEISELRRTLTQSTSIPRPKKVIVAVVGNQGMGKSSTINALLNRNLVEVLGGSEACTAFATIIEYKEGAADDTTLSDIKVVFLSPDETRDFIEEHIRRYATFVAQSGLDDEEEELDAQDSDSPAQEAAREEKQTISKAVEQGADTAEEFFRIMFNTDSDEVAEGELSRWLKEQDLEDGRFLERLMQLATDHVYQIQHQEAGSHVYTDVRDERLDDVRSWAVKMWPLVKSVTIATGSVLLRQGICLMDLPGMPLH